MARGLEGRRNIAEFPGAEHDGGEVGVTIDGALGADGMREPLEDLVEAAKAGDRAAFEALLSRFEAKALGIARQMGLSPEDAQDVAQEAFLKLFRHIRKFRSGESFTNWFYRIVVHATYDHLRRHPAGRSVSLDAPGSAGAQELPAPDAGDIVEAGQMRGRVLTALRCLSPQERAAFILRDLHGLGTAQVALAMRVRQVTVRRHAQNARRKLRERLESQFPELFRS